MKKPLHVLIAEDNPNDAELIVLELTRAGFDTKWHRVETEAEFRAGLHSKLDIVLSDFAIPHFSGLRALEMLREEGMDIPFILISGTIGEDTAVAAMQHGAADYLLKDRLARLGQAVEHALEKSRVSRERKQVTEALKLFRTLVDQSNDTFEVIDPETGLFVDVNEKGCTDAGYSRKEYLALKIFDIDPMFTVSTWADWGAKLRETGQANGETQRKRKNGTTFPVEFNAKWVALDQNYIVSVVRDITRRKAAEAHLHLLETCVARLNDIILITEAEPQEEPGPRIIFVNDAFVLRTGYSRKEVIGRSPRFLQGPKTSRVELERIRVAMENWKPVRSELINYTKSGQEYWIELDIVPVANADGSFTHWVSVERDITERKQLEQQFFRAQRMESIGTLAGGIAHDLNNVLAPIIMSIELLKAKFEDEESQKLLSLISVSASRGADMVQQVISFARGVEGKKIAVQLRQVLQDVERIVNETFSKNIHIRTTIADNLWTVQGDPTQLHQVLLNLCVNARDALPAGGSLVLTAENRMLDEQYAAMHLDVQKGPYVFLQIDDTGTGMPPEVITNIFDPFFTTKEVGKGTGLGLSTALAIIKSHGGSIQVESEIGRGTKFKILLPASNSLADLPLDRAATQMPMGNGELILVVDDEPSIREITRQTLEEFGYRVVLAADGAEAVSIYAARTTEIALVLTDLTMPIMDGPTTIQVLKKMNPAVRIVAASGLSAGEQLAAMGVHHFLPKPYTAETMLKTLQARLQEAV